MEDEKVTIQAVAFEFETIDLSEVEALEEAVAGGCCNNN